VVDADVAVAVDIAPMVDIAATDVVTVMGAGHIGVPLCVKHVGEPPVINCSTRVCLLLRAGYCVGNDTPFGVESKRTTAKLFGDSTPNQFVTRTLTLIETI
jgi:hypothetical protein